MSTRNAVVVLILLAAAGGAWWYFTKPVAPAAPAPVSVATSTLSYTLTPQGDRYHEETTDTYSIKATYPSLANPLVMAAVEKIVTDEISGFKTDAAGMIDEAEAARIRKAGRPYTFTIDYVSHPSSKFSSYEFDIYTDTGGAHPNTMFRTLSLDATGATVTLESLFQPDAPYLARLSVQSYTRVLDQLRAKSGGDVTPEMEDEVRVGTSPTPETLQFFYIADDGLHMLFPPYQVAAYAAGSFDVAIPWSALQDILKPGIAAAGQATTTQSQ